MVFQMADCLVVLRVVLIADCLAEMMVVMKVELMDI